MQSLRALIEKFGRPKRLPPHSPLPAHNATPPNHAHPTQAQRVQSSACWADIP